MAVIVVPAFAMSFDALPNYQDEGMKLYIRGTGKLQSKDYVGAVADLRRSVKMRPDMAEAFHNLGFAFERTGNIQNAAKAYERALRLKPNYPSALNNLGYLLATTGNNPQRGVLLCRKAVELQPNSASFRDSLGWANYKAGNLGDAVESFKMALKINPSFFKSYFNLGLVEFKRKRYSIASEYFKSAVRLNPNFVKTYIPLADCYEKLNKSNKALYVYQQALNRVDDSSPIKRHIERKIKSLTKKSKSYYFSSIKKMKGSSKIEAFMNRKSRTSKLGKYSTASNPLESNGTFTPISAGQSNSVRSYETQIIPNNYSAIQPQRMVTQTAKHITSSNWQDSYTKPTVMTYSRLTVKQERELDRKYSLSKSYLDRGLTQEAARELKQIISVSSTDSTVGRQARNLLLRVQKQIEAKREAKAMTHKDMGKDFFRSGQYDMAEEEFNKALQLNPESAEIYKDLALLHYNLGKFKEAYEESKRAIALDRTMKEAYVVLGSLYAKKGRTDDALRTLRKVKEISTNHDAVDELAEKMIVSVSGEY